MKKRVHTYGGEIEKPIANKATSAPHKISQTFFKTLEKKAKKRGTFDHLHKSDVEASTLGVISKDLGEQGIDNGWNLLETSLPYQTSLSDLNTLMIDDLKVVQKTLENEDATTINLSIHPLAKTDDASYKKFVAPKGLYSYLHHRGQYHQSGIDAKAQNSPATGVSAGEAAEAVSAIIGAGAAMVALFANSPYAEENRTPFKESRLTIWERMFATSKIPGDLRVSKFPPKRFNTMAEYFTWMFSEDSAIYFVMGEAGNDYKSIIDRALIIESHPSVLTYLENNSWKATRLRDLLDDSKGNAIEVSPHLSHMELMQFAQFTGARIRYGLNHETLALEEFIEAVGKTGKQDVEKLFEKHASFVYIEGRDPGANFPDSELLAIGVDVAMTTIIGPSALQAGILQNLTNVTRYLNRYNWSDLGGLRDEAIKSGLQGTYNGISVADFTGKIMDIAAEGLPKKDRKFLTYAQHVLKTNQNGADRAIQFVAKQKRPLPQALRALVKHRSVVVK